MMQRKFQYMVIGAGLTLLVIFGALTLLLPSTQASNSANVPANDPGLNTNFLNEELSISTESRSGSTLGMAAIPETNQDTSEGVSEERGISPELSAVDNPETDVSKILEQIMVFVEKNEANLFGQPGWLYQKHEYYQPLKYVSNTGDIYGISVIDLYGTDTVTHEEWYEVDTQGFFERKIGQMTDTNGVIRNQWAVTNGSFIALSLVNATEEAIRSEHTIRSAIANESDFATLLEMAQEDGQIISAWFEGNQYIVMYTTIYDEPRTNNADEAVQGSQVIYGFNSETGAVELFEVKRQLTSGEWIVTERHILLEQRMVEELPPILKQKLDEAATLVEESQS